MGNADGNRKDADNAVADQGDKSSLSDKGHAPARSNSGETAPERSSLGVEGGAASEKDAAGADRSEVAAARDSLAGDLAGNIEPELAPDADENADGSDPQR